MPSSFRSVVVGRVLMVRGEEELTAGRLAAVLRLVAETRKAVGRPIIYAPVILSGAGVPSADVRDSMRKVSETLLHHCETVVLVLPSASVMQSVVRSAIRGLILVTGMSSRVRLETDLEHALAHAGDLGAPLSEVMRAARQAGIWNDPARPAAANE